MPGGFQLPAPTGRMEGASVTDQNAFTGGSWPAAKVSVFLLAAVQSITVSIIPRQRVHSLNGIVSINATLGGGTLQSITVIKSAVTKE